MSWLEDLLIGGRPQGKADPAYIQGLHNGKPVAPVYKRPPSPRPTTVQNKRPWQASDEDLLHAVVGGGLSTLPYVGPTAAALYSQNVGAPRRQAQNESVPQQQQTTGGVPLKPGHVWAQTGLLSRGKQIPVNAAGLERLRINAKKETLQTLQKLDEMKKRNSGEIGNLPNPWANGPQSLQSTRGTDDAPDGSGSQGTNLGWKGITPDMMKLENLRKSPYFEDKVYQPLQGHTEDKSIFDAGDLKIIGKWNESSGLGGDAINSFSTAIHKDPPTIDWKGSNPENWMGSGEIGWAKNYAGSDFSDPVLSWSEVTGAAPGSLNEALDNVTAGGSWANTPLNAEDMQWVGMADDAKQRRDIMLGGGHSMDALNQLKASKGYITRGGNHYMIDGDGIPVAEDVFRNDMGWGTGAEMNSAAIDSENLGGITQLGGGNSLLPEQGPFTGQSALDAITRWRNR